MISRTTERFRKAFEALPPEVQQRARRAYRQWLRNPFHPSLGFKPIHVRRPVYAVRIGIHWRALGVRRGELVVWFWIGSHAEYDGIVSRL